MTGGSPPKTKFMQATTSTPNQIRDLKKNSPTAVPSNLPPLPNLVEITRFTNVCAQGLSRRIRKVTLLQRKIQKTTPKPAEFSATCLFPFFFADALSLGSVLLDLSRRYDHLGWLLFDRNRRRCRRQRFRHWIRENLILFGRCGIVQRKGGHVGQSHFFRFCALRQEGPCFGVGDRAHLRAEEGKG